MCFVVPANPARTLYRPRRRPGNATRLRSALRLPGRLVDMDLYRECLARAAVSHAAQRGRPEVVQADRDPDMGVGGAEPVCPIECDPTQLWHVSLGPGVAGILLA